MRQLPRVFVGSAYGRPFNFSGFRQALDALPFRIVYAKDHMTTDHILTNCRDLIERADFCLFDVSTWNANVTLELGLAYGLKKNYYILCKTNARGVPADLSGLQRIEYSAYPLCGRGGQVLAHGLWHRVAESLAAEQKLLAPLWRDLGTLPNPDKSRLFAFRLLAGLRDHKSIPIKRVADYSTPTRLQGAERDKALSIMSRKNLIDVRTRTIVLQRRGLFPPP